MNKAIRYAIAAAFGTTVAFPAISGGFEASGPDPRPGEVGNTLSDIAPPGLSASQTGPRYQHRPGPNMEWSMAQSTNEFGSPAGDLYYDRLVHLGANPGNVGVAHGETVKFVTANGREFRWRFDTLKRVHSFPLASIAPADMGISRSARVYVNGGDEQLQGSS